jgi:hypothetical protein
MEQNTIVMSRIGDKVIVPPLKTLAEYEAILDDDTIEKGD